MKDQHEQTSLSGLTRRGFIQSSAGAGGAWFLASSQSPVSSEAGESQAPPIPNADGKTANAWKNLSPARWIWYPSGRCLQNTFILFRRELLLPEKPKLAKGWILADSRYRLEVNGRRIQWGPAPCDPRWMEADPLDLTQDLKKGVNVLGAQVLFYGQGDGTWPVGKPGFLFYLEIETADGEMQKLVSDASWFSHLCRAWQPGHYKRWYLRCLQEEFDARLYPYGWTTDKFAPESDWLPAMELDCPPDKPAICSNYPEYMLDMRGDPSGCGLRPRSIPALREYMVPVERLAETYRIRWNRPPEEYFECTPPNAFTTEPLTTVAEIRPGEWRAQCHEEYGTALTFELKEQVVGWPYFTIEAPEGTVVELLVHEAHRPGGPALLNTHYHSWSRFTCGEGVNDFETFDFESCRWIQLHIHNVKGVVNIKQVGVRRRIFPWPNEPKIACSDAALQRLIDASVNTLHNCAQETLVDGMARERQQYSGDCGHQLHAIYYTFGETRLPARYLKTFSQGITQDGYFLDCWPAYDRLARLMERQLQLSGWGPILDHGVGFNFDCWHHYLYTGRLEDLKEPYPRLLRFAKYLMSIQEKNGLLPVENLGIPSVWIDHIAYQRQRHKQCAFNLYAAAMLEHALAPLCRAFGDIEWERQVLRFARRILRACINRFWNRKEGRFVVNLPWLAEEGAVRLCDRSLATAILFDQCPGGAIEPSLQALAECPAEMGFSYPANAGWRLWALSKGGRSDVVLKDLRERWAIMDSVTLNRTLQEDWKSQPDAGAQWSHCAVAPLYILYMSIAGIRPLTPGFARCEIRPQPADLEQLHLIAHTVRGPIALDAQGKPGNREMAIVLPPGCEGELVARQDETVSLEKIRGSAPKGWVRYRLPAGKKTVLRPTQS